MVDAPYQGPALSCFFHPIVLDKVVIIIQKCVVLITNSYYKEVSYSTGSCKLAQPRSLLTNFEVHATVTLELTCRITHTQPFNQNNDKHKLPHHRNLKIYQMLIMAFHVYFSYKVIKFDFFFSCCHFTQLKIISFFSFYFSIFPCFLYMFVSVANFHLTTQFFISTVL